VPRFFLVGFMGAGKTTLGRRAAERLSLPFFDLDERIERESSMSVSEIFLREGEAEFRRRESEALSRLVAAEERGIIATGGGAFTVEENRRLMSESGVVVWLDVSAEEILDRISEAGSRPLWKGPDEVRRLLDERRACYRRAHHRLALSNANPDEGVERLCRLLADYTKGP
jgi:shikimate kinase